MSSTTSSESESHSKPIFKNHITQLRNPSKVRHVSLPQTDAVQDSIAEATTVLSLVFGMMAMFIKYRWMACVCLLLAMT